jgi:hypothetical protein
MTVRIHGYTRRGKNGNMESIPTHDRHGVPPRAKRNSQRAWKAIKRHKKLSAAMFGMFAVTELVLWATNASLAAALFGVAIVGVLGSKAIYGSARKAQTTWVDHATLKDTAP